MNTIDALKTLQSRLTDRYDLVTLPSLFSALPPMTLGQYHDELRAMRDAGLIVLRPYTRALASIPDPRNALFLDGEVMYYVSTKK